MPSRSEKGVSLVEATVILTVFAVLTAVIAPVAGNYIADARAAQAREDVETIGSALSRMLADVGEQWVLRVGNTSTTGPPSHASSNRVDLLVGDGTTPAVNVARSGGGTPDWGTAVNDTTVQTISHHLVANTPSNSSANAYRTAPNMGTTDNFDPTSGASFNGEYGWRGAYLPGEVGPDPWGTRYAVNVEFLARALGTGPAGNVNDVFVLCAGANKGTDTRFDVDGVTREVDDIIYIVSGGTR